MTRPLSKTKPANPSTYVAVNLVPLVFALFSVTPAKADSANASPVRLMIDRGSGQSVAISKAGDALGAPIELRGTGQDEAQGPELPGGTPLSGLPVSSSKVSSRFGLRSHPVLGGKRMHSGVDLAAQTGSPVVAAADGIVSFANWKGSYGLLVTLRHGGGFETRFAHLSRIMVSPGQRVARGQVLGLVGSTGRSTGAHLHYEVRHHGLPIDPMMHR